MNINNKKIAATYIVCSFIIAVYVGTQFPMKMGAHGDMQNCPLLGQFEEACPMTVAEHILAWKLMFTATLQQNVLSKLLLILASFTFPFIVFRYPRFLSFQNTAPPFQKDYILAAFSEGVLRKKE